MSFYPSNIKDSRDNAIALICAENTHIFFNGKSESSIKLAYLIERGFLDGYNLFTNRETPLPGCDKYISINHKEYMASGYGASRFSTLVKIATI